MLERFHHFSCVCAVVLFCICLALYVKSTLSHDYERSSWHVFSREAPLIAYSTLALFYIVPKNTTFNLVIYWTYFILVWGVFMRRLLKYEVRRGIHERAQLLVGLDEVRHKIAELSKSMTPAGVKKPERPSRYERTPVI